MAQNIENTQDDNPNFDKEYYKREIEKMDFQEMEDLGNTDFMASFEKMQQIREYAHSPAGQVRHIADGT